MKSAQQFEDEWYQANWPGDYKSAETATGPFHDKWQLRDLVKAAQADALEAAALATIDDAKRLAEMRADPIEQSLVLQAGGIEADAIRKLKEAM